MNAKKHEVPEALLASLLADYKKPEKQKGSASHCSFHSIPYPFLLAQNPKSDCASETTN